MSYVSNALFLALLTWILGYICFVLVRQNGLLDSYGLSKGVMMSVPTLTAAIGMLFMFLLFALFGSFLPHDLTVPRVLKVLLPVLLLAGAVFRMVTHVYLHVPIVIEDGTYYYAAMVTVGTPVEFVPYGLSFIYTCLLRGLFLFFGNDPLSGIVLQVIFFFAILLFTYISVYRLCGFSPALLTLGALAFWPGTLKDVFSLDPHMFFLFSHILGLFFFSICYGRFKEKKITGFWKAYPFLFFGIFTACLMYLDLSMAILIFYVLWLFLHQIPDPENRRYTVKPAVFAFLHTVMGLLIGCGMIACLLYVSGRNPVTYMAELEQGYFSSAYFGLEVLKEATVPFLTVLSVLLLLCVWSVCGYWGQKQDRYFPFVLSVILLSLMQAFHVYVADLHVLLQFYFILLAAMGIQALFLPMGPEEAESGELIAKEKKAAEDEILDVEELERQAEEEEKEEKEEEIAETSQTMEVAEASLKATATSASVTDPDASFVTGSDKVSNPVSETSTELPDRVMLADGMEISSDIFGDISDIGQITVQVSAGNAQSTEGAAAAEETSVQPAHTEIHPVDAVKNSVQPELAAVHPAEGEGSSVQPAVHPVAAPGTPLANPLKLPKKKPRKEMTYGRKIPEELMHFDLEVSDEDDFDFD